MPQADDMQRHPLHKQRRQPLAAWRRLPLCLIVAGTIIMRYPLPGDAALERQADALFRQLNPSSLQQHGAFYCLYCDTPAGRLCGAQLCKLLGVDGGAAAHRLFDAALDINDTFSALPQGHSTSLRAETLRLLDEAGHQLANRRLQGWHAVDSASLLALAPADIDVARALLLSGASDDATRDTRQYEAVIDLLALQVKARLSAACSPLEVIDAINRLLFDELGMRFPSRSRYLGTINQYTTLEEVLTTRRGVCLGVTVLYMSVAQRLGLPLQLITPPGHILLRWQEGDDYRNIETTAGGVHLPDAVYSGIEGESLPRRNNKEVIGLVHFNLAAALWQQGDIGGARRQYQLAGQYLGDDPLLALFHGVVAMLDGDASAGRTLLQRARQAKDIIGSHCYTMATEILDGTLPAHDLFALLQERQTDSDALAQGIAEAEEALQRNPRSALLHYHLAQLWRQRHRNDQAFSHLEKYCTRCPDDLEATVTLAQLAMERAQYGRAQQLLDHAVALLKNRGKAPTRALRTMRLELASRWLPASAEDAEADSR